MYNTGNMRFRNIGSSTGAAYGVAPGYPIAAMGADWNDYDGNGRQDLVISGFSNESYSLLGNMGKGILEQHSATTGLASATFKPLGFGTKWLDMDNDGWLDISFVNGHVYDRSEQMRQPQPFRQPTMLFHSQQDYLEGRKFSDIAPRLGGAVAKPILGRGSATGDYDNDGRMDLLLVDYEGEVLLLRNVSKTGNNWIKLDLRSPSTNRFAYGAKVTARSGSRVWRTDVSPTSSYLSSSDPRIHFGLGERKKLDSITIRWPSGRTQILRNPPINQVIKVEENRGLSAK
jgi:hypothetical protein